MSKISISQIYTRKEAEYLPGKRQRSHSKSGVVLEPLQEAKQADSISRSQSKQNARRYQDGVRSSVNNQDSDPYVGHSQSLAHLTVHISLLYRNKPSGLSLIASPLFIHGVKVSQICQLQMFPQDHVWYLKVYAY